MPHPHYQKLVETRVKSAIEETKAHSPTKHQGLKGFFREIVIKRLFEPLLINEVGIAKGQIIDSYGSTSDECDLILYHKNIIPPWLTENTFGDIPVESAFINIEVKSKLDLTELRTTVKKAESIKRLRVIKDIGIRANSLPTNALIALESDLTYRRNNDIERYIECFPSARENPDITSICVVGKGYWYFNYELKRWIDWNKTDNYSEITSFIAGVLNTISMMTYDKHQIPFGYYFIDEKDSRKYL